LLRYNIQFVVISPSLLLGTPIRPILPRALGRRPIATTFARCVTLINIPIIPRPRVRDGGAEPAVRALRGVGTALAAVAGAVALLEMVHVEVEVSLKLEVDFWG
jgi:hypothetical protein